MIHAKMFKFKFDSINSSHTRIGWKIRKLDYRAERAVDETMLCQSSQEVKQFFRGNLYLPHVN